MYKVTLDFEKNMITWDTDNMKGTEYCPELAERKQDILDAMGYSETDISEEIDAINGFLNGGPNPFPFEDETPSGT